MLLMLNAAAIFFPDCDTKSFKKFRRNAQMNYLISDRLISLLQESFFWSHGLKKIQNRVTCF